MIIVNVNFLGKALSSFLKCNILTAILNCNRRIVKAFMSLKEDNFDVISRILCTVRLIFHNDVLTDSTCIINFN